LLRLESNIKMFFSKIFIIMKIVKKIDQKKSKCIFLKHIFCTFLKSLLREYLVI